MSNLSELWATKSKSKLVKTPKCSIANAEIVFEEEDKHFSVYTLGGKVKETYPCWPVEEK